jgi:hypothetical protein
MPSVYALYNEEVVQGHREALAALRELLTSEADPTERRRLATAILRTRQVKDPHAVEPQPAPAHEPTHPAAPIRRPPATSSSRRNAEPDRPTSEDDPRPLGLEPPQIAIPQTVDARDPAPKPFADHSDAAAIALNAPLRPDR